ncbi:MAG TPA: O-antigen ligase family protein [Vicinamibacteria bacterium]|nr:O-antigen ligase family protein [Vicinamibacteria bacterium]
MSLRSAVYGLVLLAFVAERPAEQVYFGYWRTALTPVGTVFFSSLPGIRLPLWDLLILVLFALSAARGAAPQGRARPLDIALKVSFAGIALTLAWGMLRGGSFYQSFFQLHVPLLTFVLISLFLGTLHTPRAIAALGRVVFVAALVRAGLAILFFLMVVRGANLYPFPSYMTTHDDSVLFVVGVLLAASWALAKGTWMAWAYAFPGIAFILLAIHLNQRRVAWLSLAAGLLVMYLLVSRKRRRRVNRWIMLAAPVIVLYVVVGWGRDEGIFSPLRSFSSVSGAQEDDSTKSREIENDGLVYTFSQHPLLGTGWGHEYEETSTLYSRGLVAIFPQYRYIPHNSLVGVLAFAGIVGFGMIWMTYSVGTWLAVRTARRARTRIERAGGMSAAAGILVYLIQAYGDMGIQSITAAVTVAACVASASRLSVRTGAWPGRRLPQDVVPLPLPNNDQAEGHFAAGRA